jgi:hypothetical protein
MDSSDGDVIYNGTGRTVNDDAVSPGVTYYYGAFIKDIIGNFSSGSIASYLETVTSGCTNPVASNYNAQAVIDDGSCLFVIPPEGKGCTDSGARNYNPKATVDDGSCSYRVDNNGGGGYSPGFIGSGPILPFEQLRTNLASSTKIISELFVFKQSRLKTKPFFDGAYVKIQGDRLFTISVDYYKMPEVLKTIGVTFQKEDDPQKTFSFLLTLNKEKTAYEATISPTLEEGTYKVIVYLVNYQDETIRKYSGQVAIVGSLGIFGAEAEKFVKQVAGPVVVTGGVTAGFFQILFSSGSIGSFSDIYIFLLRQIGAIMGLLGIKKKNKPWGTVYDSITKRPIDPAYVSVVVNNKDIATAITDIDGRYGFSLLDGDYRLKANKTHYVFPSTLLRGKTDDVMYDNLYFGEQFHISAGDLINKNIPLDPIGFDWNEFVKGKGNYFKLYASREVLRSRVIYWMYAIGLFVSLFYLVFSPSIINIIALMFYAMISVFGRYLIKKHKVVTIKTKNGEPASFAIVRAYYADLDQEIKKVVCDMVGRFFLLVRPGTYYLTVDHKQPDGTYARIYKSPVKELKNGVWSEDILV